VKARIGAWLVTLAAACAADAGDAPKSVGAAVSGSGSVSAVSGSGSVSAASGSGSVSSSGAGTGASGGDEAGMAPEAGSSSDAEVEDATVAASEDGPLEVSATDQLGPTVSCTTCPIELKYTTTTTAATQDIRPHYEIDNNGTSAQSLTDLTVRYYFTADGSAQQSYACDYAAIGCGSIQATFATITPAKTNADHYFELSFTAGSIPAGSSSGEIQVRFHDSNYQVTFNQTNDYSFDPSTTQYADWNNVTVYRNGTLVWGTEPQ
jgi:cellulose binding protein with CBM3 domain